MFSFEIYRVIHKNCNGKAKNFADKNCVDLLVEWRQRSRHGLESHTLFTKTPRTKQWEGEEPTQLYFLREQQLKAPGLQGARRRMA